MNETSQGISGPYKLITTLPGLDTSYEIKNLVEETTYYFKILAFDYVPTNSSFSNIAYATTPDETPPLAPSGLTVTDPTVNSLKITWDENQEDDLIGYNLYRSKFELHSFEQININPLTSTEYIDNDLDEYANYYYKLTAVDDADLESPFSNIATGKTLLGQYPPVINSTIDLIEILEDTADYSINLFQWFTDINNDTLTYRFEGNFRIDLTFFDNNGSVLMEPELNWNGEQTITFYATDKHSPEVFKSITVKVTPVNDPPVTPMILNPKDNDEFNETDRINFYSICTDPDLIYGDNISYLWSSNISGELGHGKDLKNINLKAGTHKIELIVSDKEGLFTTATINITLKKQMKIDGDDSEDDKDDQSKTDGQTVNSSKNKGDIINFAIIGVIIIVIIIISLIFFLKRRKSSEETDVKSHQLPEGVLVPDQSDLKPQEELPQPEPTSQPISVPIPQPIVEKAPSPMPIEHPEMPQLPEPTPVVQEPTASAETDPDQSSTTIVSDLEIAGKTKPVTPEVREQLGGKVLIIQKEE